MIKTIKQYNSAKRDLIKRLRILHSYYQESSSKKKDTQKLTRLLTDKLIKDITTYETIMEGRIPSTLNFKEIGNIMISLRINKGFSQKQLAKRANVCSVSISQYEKGNYKKCSVWVITKILDALGVKMKTIVESVK